MDSSPWLGPAWCFEFSSSRCSGSSKNLRRGAHAPLRSRTTKKKSGRSRRSLTDRALLLWLALVFAGDLGLLGTSLAVRLRPGVLLAAAWLNPLSLYRLLAIDATAAGLEMLGPAGRCAQDILGNWLRPAALAGLLAWLGAALAALFSALRLFRRDPIGRGA